MTPASAMTGVPIAPNATGAVLAISDSPEAESGEKPRPINMRRGDRHRRAEARRAFEERAEAKGDEQELQAAIGGDAGEAALQDLELAVLDGEVVQEDDVEDDPADREQAVAAAVDRGHAAPCSAGMPKPMMAIRQRGLQGRAGRRCAP